MRPTYTTSDTNDNHQAYALYLRLFHSDTEGRLRHLKSELLSIKSELHATSAQDQSAEWAKLRRSVDKELAELEKLSVSTTLAHAEHVVC